LSFFEELKRRNVFRVSIAYVVAAWLLLQLTEVLTELLALPDVIGKAIVLFLIVGFPVAIFFAWAFELTPDGIKREHEVDRSQSAAPGTGKKLNNLILAMMAVVIAYLLYDKFSGQLPDTESDQVIDVVTEVAEQEAVALGIAVLPFANMSANEENEYFAGGIHEEILTNLSRIADLRVISRTSMLRIAETDLDVRAIGQRLGVSHVLEGSVRRAGNRVRVTVQLIDAGSDEHLWAENYDRTLTDIFAIQSDIALAIAKQLKTELTPEALASIQEVPTENAEAYDFYLHARKEVGIWRGSESFEAAKPLLEQAVALDPDFLRAQVSLVATYGRLLWTGADPERIYGAKALELVTDIRRRWPDRVEGHLALGLYYYTVERNYERALAEFRLFEDVFPNDSEMLLGLAASLKRLNLTEEHLIYTRRLVQLDPERSVSVGELVNSLQGNGLIEEAMTVIDNSVKKFPEDTSWPLMAAGNRLFNFGDVNNYLALRALDFVKTWIDAGRPFNTTTIRNWYTYAAYVAAVAGDIDAVIKYRQSAATAPEDEYFIETNTEFLDAQIDSLLGNPAQGWARITSNEAIMGISISAEYAAVHPYYKHLFGDVPAFQQYIAQVKVQN
jgi:TolB-like protein